MLWLFGVVCFVVSLLAVFVWLVLVGCVVFLCWFVSSVLSILSCLRTEAVKPAVVSVNGHWTSSGDCCLLSTT